MTGLYIKRGNVGIDMCTETTQPSTKREVWHRSFLSLQKEAILSIP